MYFDCLQKCKLLKNCCSACSYLLCVTVNTDMLPETFTLDYHIKVTTQCGGFTVWRKVKRFCFQWSFKLPRSSLVMGEWDKSNGHRWNDCETGKPRHGKNNHIPMPLCPHWRTCRLFQLRYACCTKWNYSRGFYVSQRKICKNLKEIFLTTANTRMNFHLTAIALLQNTEVVCECTSTLWYLQTVS